MNLATGVLEPLSEIISSSLYHLHVSPKILAGKDVQIKNKHIATRFHCYSEYSRYSIVFTVP